MCKRPPKLDAGLRGPHLRVLCCANLMLRVSHAECASGVVLRMREERTTYLRVRASSRSTLRSSSSWSRRRCLCGENRNTALPGLPHVLLESLRISEVCSSVNALHPNTVQAQVSVIQVPAERVSTPSSHSVLNKPSFLPQYAVSTLLVYSLPQYPFSTPSVPLQYSLSTPSVLPQYPIQYSLSAPSVLLQCPFSTASVPLQYSLCSP